MADVNKLIVGKDVPKAIMFARYKDNYNNKDITFETLIPKDNSIEAINTPSKSVWQVNNGWEVEIINSKTIAIKKFRIDTWGIRQIINPDEEGYKDFYIRVRGLSYHHKYTICHTAGSNTPDGFEKSYFSDTDEDNIDWYPGKYDNTTGKYYVKGFDIRYGIVFDNTEEERDGSLHINSNIINSTDKGKLYLSHLDAKGKAITMGLYGGVQNASYKNDFNGDAYKEYDISDYPIYVTLNTEAKNSYDLSTNECWDIIDNDGNIIYHKDKTYANVLEKNHIAYIDDDFNKVNEFGNYITDVINSSKFQIFYINELLNIHLLKRNKTTYISRLHCRKVIFYISNIPNGVTITFKRNLSLYCKNYDETTKTYSDFLDNIFYDLHKGYNIIEEYNVDYVYASTDLYQGTLVIQSDNYIYEGITIEIIVPPEDNDIIYVSGDNVKYIFYNYTGGPLIVPYITDLNNHIHKLFFKNITLNEKNLNDVIQYFANNEFNFDKNGVYNLGVINDDLIVNLPNTKITRSHNLLQFGYTKFNNIIFKTDTSDSIIVNLYKFYACGTSPINIIKTDNTKYNCLAGAKDCTSAFDSSTITEYPSNFIDWYLFRDNLITYSKNVTIFNKAFYCSKLKTIPNVYGANEHEEIESNTIVPNTLDSAFYKCTNLTSIGPIIDCAYVTSHNYSFAYCSKLTDVRLKNLNHKAWDFTSNTKDGNLINLNEDSVKYLFANLSDYKNRNIAKTQRTINNSFTLWETNDIRMNDYEEYDVVVESASKIITKRRYSTTGRYRSIISAPYSVLSMTIKVTGLVNGDRLQFGYLIGSIGKDVILNNITTDGIYTLTVTDSDLDKKTYKLYLFGDETITSEVIIEIVDGWDLAEPTYSTSTINCPSTWSDYITDDMVAAANAKGWTVYVGGVVRVVST